MKRPPVRPIVRGGLLFLLAALGADARSEVKVYSEFQRIGPFGEVVSVDRARRPGIRPREILSPSVALNGYASFHVAVTVPPNEQFTLYVGQNPENSFRVAVYKEVFSRHGGSWIPDRLEPVELPYTGKIAESSPSIPGQTTVVFWMDLWVPFSTEAGRVKVEPQLYVDGHWVTYPMEVRVIAATIPKPPAAVTPVAAVQHPADATARAVLVNHLCGAGQGSAARGRTVRSLILRNTVQDVALARALEAELGRKLLFPSLLRLAESEDSTAWCRAPVFPQDLGPEWYLRAVRDILHRMVH